MNIFKQPGCSRQFYTFEDLSFRGRINNFKEHSFYLYSQIGAKEYRHSSDKNSNGVCVLVKKFIHFIFKAWIGFGFILSLNACGVLSESIQEESVAPEEPEPEYEDAVFIEKINTNSRGTKVRCRLNTLLIEHKGDIPVFIEFEGERIETKNFPSSQATVPFDFFQPETEGFLKCVIEFADAEFESEGLWLTDYRVDALHLSETFKKE
jgi:hypothetical protein